ncbi:hypothetical protein [Caldilinea sp.]|jgi:uncharacterized membrane protein|uniref:hypothetical protein n=1 Tax=Caldilinea sp. TaxID=2293560 RepID=UPI0021DBBC59|nr:hypothetical protein [Caldilinea sp.]GIV70351.1 MAG: hypothetical protein KatS3mg048_3213 [Caldilinea sp.]
MHKPMTMHRPNRLLAALSYLLILVGPLAIVLLRRRDRFTLYHACQSLALVGGAVVVPLLWLVFGWLTAFVSVEYPLLFIIPIGLALFMPVIRQQQRAMRYKGQVSWFSMLSTLAVAAALIYATYRLIEWLAPVLLPLGGALLFMASFSIVMAAALALVIAWVAGIVNALTGQVRPVPVYGEWGQRLFLRLTS